MKIDKQNGNVAFTNESHTYWNVNDNKKYISTDLMKKEPIKENFISSDIELLHFRIL